MRHHYRSRDFGRTRSERNSLMDSLARAVITSESITTTAAKAKETSKLVERLITWGKRSDLNSRRQAFKILKDRDLIKILFDEVAPRFKNRSGGYTRIFLAGFRKGDGARMAILELVEKKPKVVKEKKKKEKKEHPEEGKKVEAKKEKEAAPEKPEHKPEAEKPKPQAAPPSKHKEITKESKKKFLGGFQKFFKKERDSL